MLKSNRLIIGIPLCFTMLVGWFAWSAFSSAYPLAAENLRGAGLSISAAIEQLVVADPSLRSLARYSTPDIAYFTLIDRHGIVRFHTNPGLIGQRYSGTGIDTINDGIAEKRELLGTGEEVYLLQTNIHPAHDEYQLVLAMHTYRADNVIRRARTGIAVVSSLTVGLWGLTVIVLYMIRREERHIREMARRKELAQLGEIGAVLAHEIRNPLGGIKGFAQLVESSDDIDQARRYAGKIVSQSIRMEALVDDLLSFARDDHGEREPVELSRLIEDCAEHMRQEAAAQQVIIEVEAASAVKADLIVDRIIQMLLNLMKNGIQSMPDGGLLKIRLWEQNGSAHISVRDHGIGIPQEDLPHIFEPFWTSKTAGTGLGLALCRKVAEEHGGTLTLESRPGVGTEFLFSAPLAKG